MSWKELAIPLVAYFEGCEKRRGGMIYPYLDKLAKPRFGLGAMGGRMASRKEALQSHQKMLKQSLGKDCKNMQKPVSRWHHPLQKDQSALLRWLRGHGTAVSGRFVLHDLDGLLMKDDSPRRQSLLKSLGLREG